MTMTIDEPTTTETTSTETGAAEPRADETRETPPRRTIEQALAAALAAFREAEAHGKTSTRDDYAQKWIAEALDHRPLILVAMLDTRSTQLWLLEPNQKPIDEIAFYVEVGHYDHAVDLGELGQVTDWGLAQPKPVTKATVDVLNTLAWLDRDNPHLV